MCSFGARRKEKFGLSETETRPSEDDAAFKKADGATDKDKFAKAKSDFEEKLAKHNKSVRSRAIDSNWPTVMALCAAFVSRVYGIKIVDEVRLSEKPSLGPRARPATHISPPRPACSRACARPLSLAVLR